MSTKTRAAPTYERALETAVAELRDLRRALEVHQHELRASERRMVELRTAIDNLLRLIPESQRNEWEAKLIALDRPYRSERRTGSPAYEGLLNLIASEPEKAWKIEELERELNALGLNPKAKTIYNTLNRLALQGRLVRIRRGVYRVPEYGFDIISTDKLLEDD